MQVTVPSKTLSIVNTQTHQKSILSKSKSKKQTMMSTKSQGVIADIPKKNKKVSLEPNLCDNFNVYFK